MNKRNRMRVEGGELVPMKHKEEIMESNDSGCKVCGSLDSSPVNGEDKMGVVCNECGETYVYPDSPGKHCTKEIEDDRDYSLFTGKPTNREFRKFRGNKEKKRRDKANKPQRTGRDMSFLDD